MRKKFIFIPIVLLLFTTSCSNTSLPNESLFLETEPTTVEKSSDDVSTMESNEETETPTTSAGDEDKEDSKNRLEIATSESKDSPLKTNSEKTNTSSDFRNSKEESISGDTSNPKENSTSDNIPNINNGSTSDNTSEETNSCNHDNGKKVMSMVDPQPDPNGCGTILYGVHRCILCREIVKYTGDNGYLPHRDTHDVADPSKDTCRLAFYNSVCNVCGEIKESYNKGSGTDHVFGEWIATSSPTCKDEQQSQQRSCTSNNCDKIETQNVWINSSDYHKYVLTGTTQHEGYKELLHSCSICGKSYSDREETPWSGEDSSGDIPNPQEETAEI